jgi:hypothetical protein
VRTQLPKDAPLSARPVDPRATAAAEARAKKLSNRRSAEVALRIGLTNRG